MTSINPKLLKDFLNELYPIGKTEIFLDNEDHSNYMGFTWQRDSVGRAIVGIDSNDTDFNTIGQTGGEKTHTLTKDEVPTGIKLTVPQGTALAVQDKILFDAAQPHNIMQPYKVFAIWVRTS